MSEQASSAGSVGAPSSTASEEVVTWLDSKYVAKVCKLSNWVSARMAAFVPAIVSSPGRENVQAAL